MSLSASLYLIEGLLSTKTRSNGSSLLVFGRRADDVYSKSFYMLMCKYFMGNLSPEALGVKGSGWKQLYSFPPDPLASKVSVVRRGKSGYLALLAHSLFSLARSFAGWVQVASMAHT